VVFKRFKDGQEQSTEDNPLSGGLSKSRIDDVVEKICTPWINSQSGRCDVIHDVVATRNKWPKKWKMISSSRNASAHSALFIREFLADKKIPVVL